MKTIFVRDVSEALPLGIGYLLTEGQRAASRAGEVIVAPVPVATVYSHPKERVLLSPIRDANAPFHLLEFLWMIAGRNDAAFLDNYISTFSTRFADNGIIHDAYGYRWRKMFGFDQLSIVVEKLKNNPDDRQCVLQMWDTDPYGADDLKGTFKTRPCNTQAYFRVNNDRLDMTVTCRSNDIIFGAYGANAVHFSFLQEYLASMIGVKVGIYTQFSFNYHAYVEELERLAKRSGCDIEYLPTTLGDATRFEPLPLVTHPATFDAEVGVLSDKLDQLHAMELPIPPTFDFTWAIEFKNLYLLGTVWNTAVAMRNWRLGRKQEALEACRSITCPAWQVACQEWFERRIK